ncbi:unnamed protein product [Discosporangium mesarthrocarpum]
MPLFLVSDKPRCRPWDYNDFIFRLRTFSPILWMAKPAAVSPLVCSMYGWTNSARDELYCSCCSVKLTYPSEGEGESYSSATSAAFAARLSSGHDPVCPWADNPCSDDFLRLPPMADEDLRHGKFHCLTVLPHRSVR